jgi:hypothetical protein
LQIWPLEKLNIVHNTLRQMYTYMMEIRTKSEDKIWPKCMYMKLTPEQIWKSVLIKSQIVKLKKLTLATVILRTRVALGQIWKKNYFRSWWNCSRSERVMNELHWAKSPSTVLRRVCKTFIPLTLSESFIGATNSLWEFHWEFGQLQWNSQRELAE